MRERTKIDVEAKLAEALRWRALDPNKNSFRQAAIKFGVPLTTLQRRHKGGKTRVEANVAAQLLLPAEERVLADAILAHADLGFPVRICQLRRWAFEILRARIPKATAVGKKWHERFLLRYPDIRVRWRQTMDRVRVKAADPESITAFFTLVSHCLYV